MCVHAGWILGACSGAEGKQRTQAPGSNPREQSVHVHARCADSDKGAAKQVWRGCGRGCGALLALNACEVELLL